MKAQNGNYGGIRAAGDPVRGLCVARQAEALREYGALVLGDSEVRNRDALALRAARRVAKWARRGRRVLDTPRLRRAVMAML